MGLFNRKTENTSRVPWVELTNENDFIEMLNDSVNEPVLIFKHSIRCSISAMAKSRLESNWDFSSEEIIPVYLDLINYRGVSNLIAEQLHVYHESPQVILIKNKKSVYTASHNAISVEALKKVL